MSVVPPQKRFPYQQWSPDVRALDLVGDKWTLLIIRDLLTGPRRFVDLQRVLPRISTEQLRSRLNRMVADGLLTRHRYREVPPRVDYELTDRARQLERVIAELSRWGYEWAWGAPRSGERVDIDAIFRATLGLISVPAGVETTVCLVVDDRSFSLRLGPDGARLAEADDAGAAARVAGPVDAWVAALGPDGERGGLTLTGDHALAGRVLDAISRGGARAGVRAA